MAIEAPQTAANFATGNYHRILKAELLCSPEEPVPRWHIMVGFYASRYARDMNPQAPMYVNHVFKAIADLPVDPRVGLYEIVMADELFAGTNATGDVDPDTTVDPQ